MRRTKSILNTTALIVAGALVASAVSSTFSGAGSNDLAHKGFAGILAERIIGDPLS